MKRIIILAIFLSITLNSMLAQSTDLSNYLRNLEMQELDDTEINGIMLMREEEKLARDVYGKLFEKWQNKIFDNIKSSEQTHMDWVAVILEKYSLKDPMLEEIGSFSNTHLQDVYNTLINEGNQSLAKALYVGCTIEDLDIKDLQDLLLTTDNIDLKIVYQNLMLGSRNHLRGFNRQYNNQGLTYTEQYISHEDLIKILDGASENGPVDENGNPLNLTSVFVETVNFSQSLAETFPNPFSDNVIIRINSTESPVISCQIIDQSGKIVKLLSKNELNNSSKLEFSFDGTNESGELLPNGIYYYSFVLGNEIQSGKLVLIR